jgi:hypothetical protein
MCRTQRQETHARWLGSSAGQRDGEVPLDVEPVVPVDPVVPPVAPLVPEVPVPVVPPGVALVEPPAPLVLDEPAVLLFVAPAPMPVALRVVVMSVDFIDVLVVDWQPAASAAARQRPNTAAGRRVDWMLMCDYS